MPLTLEIAWRYMRGHRSHLLSGTARAALASTAIGTAAMVIAMALMTGYRDELQRRLVAGTAVARAQKSGTCWRFRPSTLWQQP